MFFLAAAVTFFQAVNWAIPAGIVGGLVCVWFIRELMRNVEDALKQDDDRTRDDTQSL